jgi:hypothetical protein
MVIYSDSIGYLYSYIYSLCRYSDMKFDFAYRNLKMQTVARKICLFLLARACLILKYNYIFKNMQINISCK